MSTFDLNLHLELSEAADNYLRSSARIRGVSRTYLLNRVFEMVLEDQLILGILDDAEVVSEHKKHDDRRVFWGQRA